MKRIIRLTERDLTRIVKRVIKEQEENLKIQLSEFPQVIRKFITDNGFDINNFEWEDSSKGQVFYKFSNGSSTGLDTMSVFESNVNTYNKMKSNFSICDKKHKRWLDLNQGIHPSETSKRKGTMNTLNKEFPNTGWCKTIRIIQNLIDNK